MAEAPYGDAALRPPDAGAVRGRVAATRRPGVRRPPVLFRAPRSRGACRRAMTTALRRDRLLPLALLLRRASWRSASRGRRAGALRGVARLLRRLGVGFIAVELALLQHLTLLLGHPIFTLSILLFTLLAAGGLGSCAQPRFRTPAVCLAVAALGVGLRVRPAARSSPRCCRCRSAAASRSPWRSSRRSASRWACPFRSGLQRAGGAAARAAVLLGPERHHVGDRLDRHHADRGTLGFQVAMLAGAGCYVCAALAGRRLSATAALPLEAQSPAA